jgi:CRISPR-associated protein Csb2
MSSYFCITVRFLQPYSHGRGDGGVPEWPLSPLRLFQALIAASAARWNERMRLSYAVPALEWLERQSTSTIATVVGMPSDNPYLLYIPNNATELAVPAWRKGDTGKAVKREQKIVCPTHLAGEAAHYLCRLPDDLSECEKHLGTLRDAARSITHLGWGIDMVAANADVISEADADKLPGERWRPVEDSSAPGYRVPIPGTLNALIQKHQAFLTRLGPDGFKPVPPLSAFRVVGYRRTTDVPVRPYVAFKLLHPVLDRSAWLPATRANCVAAMTRHATAEAAQHQGRENEWVDSYVHGHRSTGEDTKPRFSYLPLPTIEHRGEGGCVVGGIRRVILAELVEASAGYPSWARQMLPGQFLIDEQSEERVAMLAPLNESDWVLRQYTGSSDTWATITPVVLPGSDEGKFAKAEKLFFKALRHAGYSSDALSELEFRNVSFWPGGDLALRFQRPDYLRKNSWSVHHMRLRWKQRIKGPLALGAGRHCGLGIFAAFN